jgi:hypothetical protein
MGLHPDTPPEDLMLVAALVDERGHQIGVEPSAAVRDEYERTRRWVQAEVDAREKGRPDATRKPQP